MATKKFFKGIAIFASSAILSISTLQSASAAPGTLVQAPLFLSTLVEPNVFFNLDDSGSMDWNPIFVDGTAGVVNNPGTGVPIIDGDDRAYYNPSFTRLYPSRGYLPPYGVTVATASEQARWDRSWVVRNHIANRSYYNPSTTYLPWAGSKSDGSPMYPAADPTAALQDPYRPWLGSVDLTVRQNWGGYNGVYYIPTYFIWPDSEADGVMDQTDIKTRVEILAGSTEMQNFANWFVYYRSRSHAAKAVIGNTINNTNSSRRGMFFFNDTIERVVM
jgi:type IV pilus assembly protein PilY1